MRDLCNWCHDHKITIGKGNTGVCSESCRLDLEYFDANPHLSPFEDKRPDKVLQKGETIGGGTVESQVKTIETQLENFDSIVMKLVYLKNFDDDDNYSKEACDMVRAGMVRTSSSKSV